MEKRLNTKVEQFVTQFKEDIREKIIGYEFLEQDKAASLMEFIYDYGRLVVDKDDFVKRKRVKNSIPESNRCIAMRANGEQCTRRRKTECDYCGTHSKGTPHGVLEATTDNVNMNQTVETFAQEVKGIVYYLDTYGNVYNTEDIMSEKENPRIIAKWVKDYQNAYTIPELGLV